jgi:hypothetical protein
MLLQSKLRLMNMNMLIDAVGLSKVLGEKIREIPKLSREFQFIWSPGLVEPAPALKMKERVFGAVT